MSKVTTTKIKSGEPYNEILPTQKKSILDSIFIFLDRNTRGLAFGFIAVLLACAVYFLWSYFRQNAALEKFEAAFQIEKQILEFEDKSKKNKPEDDKASTSDTKQQPVTTASQSPDSLKLDNTTQIDQIHAEVIKFIKEDPSHGASRNLALKWSKTLYTEEKFDKALETLQQLKFKKSNSLEGLTLLSKASLSLQAGQIKDSIQLFKEIVSTKKWTYLHPEARFQLSLALIKDNNPVEAIENLKTIKNEFPDEKRTVEDATKLLRWLQYQKVTAPK